MDNIVKLIPQVQHYAWGLDHGLSRLFGLPLEGGADVQAELWMGAHPKAPSHLASHPKTSLLDAISQDPTALLGPKTAKRYGALPFLFKVLAIGSPLSLQVHPTSEQAQRGFERENRKEIALSSDRRSYKDPHRKPEIITAFSGDLWALCGFRSETQIEELFSPLPAAKGILKTLSKEGLKAFTQQLLFMKESERNSLLAEAELRLSADGPFHERWALKLLQRYPGDIGALAPLFLNVMHLSPGQALFLPAGQLHAYLQGIGVELMGNSDNVIRAGLTPKYVDSAELLSITCFSPYLPQLLTPQEGLYVHEGTDFRLARYDLSLSQPRALSSPAPAQIVFCAQGSVTLEAEGKLTLPLKAGESAFVSYGYEGVRLLGEGIVFSALSPVL